MGDAAEEQSKLLKQEFVQELDRIVHWWSTVMLDETNGGFIGEVDARGVRVVDANKGVILNTRMLWFFSEAAMFSGAAEARRMADRSYRYLIDYFLDSEYGGFYWELDAKGTVLDTKKQTYAQAFALYGLSSYFQLSKDEQALSYARDTFAWIEGHCRDSVNGGYLEAFDKHWKEIDDMRLSDKDANYPKSQNTHLHVLECYTNLQAIAPSADVEAALEHCINCFSDHILDAESFHLRMFMDKQWKDYSDTYSYGHDIEFSWLLNKALKALNNSELSRTLKSTVLKLADVCLTEAVTKEGKVLDDYNFKTDTLRPESCWWIQAEAMVGFLNAYKLSGDAKYFNAFNSIWNFTKREHIDLENGEWHWLGKSDQDHNYSDYKAGFWKAPYHNGRSMMEVIKLL